MAVNECSEKQKDTLCRMGIKSVDEQATTQK